MRRLSLLVLLTGIFFGNISAKTQELTLKHSYTFTDGSAKDVVSGADGTVVGGGISKGVYTASLDGDYITLPAEEIAINTYSEITIETYVSTVAGANTGATMLWYFGSTNDDGYGTYSFFNCIARSDDMSKAAMSTVGESPWSAEVGPTGDELDDGELHHIVVTVDASTISMYIDGTLAGSETYTDSENAINLISTDYAYIAKGGYSSDPSWIGSVIEYNIYSGVMDATTVLDHSENYPLDDDATLSSLTFSEGTLSPSFVSETTEYVLDVPYGTSTISLTTKMNGVGSTVKVMDMEYNELDAENLDLGTDGINVYIEVTSIFGTTTTYYVEIYVADGTSDADLKAIDASIGAIDPLFEKNTVSYTILVPQGTETVELTGTANSPLSSVDGNGTITLTDGTATAQLTVTANDASKSKTYTVTFKEADGKNYAMYLPGGDGNYSNIDISGLELTSLPFTLEMWIRPDGDQAYNAGIFYNRPGNIGLQYASSWQGYNMLRFMTTEGEGEQYGSNSLTGVVATNNWHHVAVVVADTSRTIYLDGVESTEKNEFSTIDFESGNLYLGWDSDADSKAFSGWIDEVRVWNKVIPLDSLQQNKTNSFTGKEEGLIAYYSFDLRNSDQAVDLSSNRHHGIISGGTYAQSFSRNNTELSTLTINEGEYKPGFDGYTTDYYITFPAGTPSFTVNAEALSAEATVSGAGLVNIENERDSVIITVYNQDESQEYVIHYNVYTDLELKHSYTFGDGTARDVVSGADAEVVSGTISEGIYHAEEEGDYINLPGSEIALNTYAAYTMEAYIQQGINPESEGNAMLTYFGDFQDQHVTWIQIARNDDISKAKLATDNDNVETFTVGGEPGVDEYAHIVFVCRFDSMFFYMNGQLVDSEVLYPESIIAKISTENAWLCASGWAHDPTWIGDIYEFNIYEGEMDAQTVAIHANNFPYEGQESDATLADIFIDGSALTGFSSTTLNYYLNAEDFESVPEVMATAKVIDAEVTIEKPESLPGNITITVTSADKQSEVVYTIYISLASGVAATNADVVKVYPTFTNGDITVETTAKNSIVTVYNLSGSLVYQQTMNADKQTISLDLPGIYLVKVANGTTNETFKVVKTH